MNGVDAPVMLLAGGTGSIGSAIAVNAINAGWRVALHGSSKDTIQAAIDRLLAAGMPAGHMKGFAADIRQPDAIESLVGQATAWADRIDAAVDCVSTGPNAKIPGLFAQTDPTGFGSLMDLSISHLQRLTHAVLPWLARRGGTLIAFASDAGRFAAPHQSLIGTSRAAIIGFVRNLAVEVARDAVRVHCVCPSFVEGTASAQRMAVQNGARLESARRRAGLGLPTPADIAPLVLFLCSEHARRITGQIISINGGMNA